MTCDAGVQHYLNPGFWNVLPWFDDVKADNEVGNVPTRTTFHEIAGRQAGGRQLDHPERRAERAPAEPRLDAGRRT